MFIVDHIKEPEEVLRRNLTKVRAALAKGEGVRIYHFAGHIHGRLANIPGVEYVTLGQGGAPDARHGELYRRLTTLNEEHMAVARSPKGDLFIHWYYRDRSEDRLSACEVFHLNMLRHFNAMDRVVCIHVRCAAKCGGTMAQQEAIRILSGGTAKVDFRVVRQASGWEHDTFKEAVEYAVASGKFVYYTHFKGVTHIADRNVIGGYRNGSRTNPSRRILEMDVLYWAYVMYRYLFVDAPEDAIAIGPIHHSGNTLHYSRANAGLMPAWAYKACAHYTGSFQAFDGAFLKRRLEGLGATEEVRRRTLWRNDPYTVEQFLTLCFRREEVATLGQARSAYTLYTDGMFPAYRKLFDALYAAPCRNICVANGTYKWIGGTDTFNWALCKALLDLGYNVYYYSPDMDGNGVTERHLKEIGVRPYTEGTPLAACFANQQSGRHFVGRCPVVQTCHSAYTDLELPIRGATAYVSISEEIQDYLRRRGQETVLIRNGIDLGRYAPRNPLRGIPRVLSICQGDDSLLREACGRLGWDFFGVPKEVGGRIWNVEDLINQADIVVGIGRSLYDAMACGRACVSWDNRKLNPYSGCGYVTADNWHEFARTNFTGRGYPRIDFVGRLVAELRKYNPADGDSMRRMAEAELNMAANARRYLELAGIMPLNAP